MLGPVTGPANINYVLHEDDDDIYHCKNKTSWSGFDLREARHGAKANICAQLKDATKFRNFFRN